MSNALRLEDSVDPVSVFRQLCDQIVALTSEEGIHVFGYRSPDLPYFSKLPAEAQQKAIRDLGFLTRLCGELKSSGGRLRDPVGLAWIFLKHFQMTLPSTTTLDIRPGDLVDIYNEHHQLLFASFMLFEVSLYSLEELYCRPWMELFTRENPEVHQELFRTCEALLKGEFPQGRSMTYVPPHVLRQSDYPDQGWVKFQPIVFSPLFQNGKPAGYLCVNRVVDGSPEVKAKIAH